jgi:hypothetical protein
MTVRLTDAQSDLINTTEHTHDYMHCYDAEEHGDSDHSEYYTEQFERETNVLERGTANDVGGIIIYMQGPELVAFFDYENLAGTVFQ